MNKITRILSIILLLSLLMNASSALADENSFQGIFKDALYGGAVGTLVGGALLAFTKKPADHLDYMGYGAAAGILTGATFGLAKSAKALAEIDKGRVRIAVPIVLPDLVESHAGTPSIFWRADIIRGSF